MIRWFYTAWKTFFWVLLGIAATVVLLAAVAYGLLQTQWLKNAIATRIEQAYASSLNSELKIGSLEGVLPSRIVLNQVSVVTKDRVGSPADTVASIRRVEVALDIWNYLFGRIEVTGLHLDSPRFNVRMHSDSLLNTQVAFRSLGPSGEPSPTYVSSSLRLYAPAVRVTDGAVIIDETVISPRPALNAGEFVADSIQASLFVEVSATQRFVDISQLAARLSLVETQRVQITGQLFSDANDIEVNRLRISTPRSELVLDAAASGVDLNQRGSFSRLSASRLSLRLDAPRLEPAEIAPWVNGMPPVVGPASLGLTASGRLDSLAVEQLRLQHGETDLAAVGVVRGLSQPRTMRYETEIETIRGSYEDLRLMLADADSSIARILSEVSLNGRVAGTLDTLSLDVAVGSPAGRLLIDGGTTLAGRPRYEVRVQADTLNLGRWEAMPVEDTRLNLSARIAGSGLDRAASLNGVLSVVDSRIVGVEADTLRLLASFHNGVWEPRLTAVSPVVRLRAEGDVSFFGEEPAYNLSGEFSALDLSAVSADTTLPYTSLNADFEANLRGASLDDLHGRLSLDMKPSVVGSDTLTGLQGYVDLDEPTSQNRILRLTSTVLDLRASGTLNLDQVIRHSQYWAGYMNRQVQQELLFRDGIQARGLARPPRDAINVEFSANVKDVDMVRRLVPRLDDLHTKAAIEGSVRADLERLLVTLNVADDSTHFGDWYATGVDLGVTAALRHDETLRSTANVQVRSRIGELRSQNMVFAGMSLNASWLGDTLTVEHTLNQVGEAARARYSLVATLSDSLVDLHFPSFYLGNDQYSWVATGDPHIRLLPDGKIDFQQFSFENDGQRIDITGRFSEDVDDRLSLRLIDVDLSRISDLLAAKARFDGVVNGQVTTAALRTQTNLEGHLNIEAFAVNNRIVGDLELDSRYNPEERRFDAELAVRTDSLKYASYYSSNRGIGQDILISGYLAPRNINPNSEYLYHFDVDVQEIDLWVLRYILDSVFTEIEGSASGSGFIRSRGEDLEYGSDFVVSNTLVVPVFLNTNYTLNGDLEFNSTEGLVMKDIRVTDDKRGSGVLSGTVDMNNFEPVKHLDLNLRLNRLEFLNNTFDEDTPFYGRVSGTGAIRLAGPTSRPFLQTTRPITVTPNSKLTIPLLDQTSINQQTNFIRFVNEFFEAPVLEGQDGTGNGDQPVVQRSFTDIFQMDLQFNMPQDAAIEFVFDPVTNEYLTTRGTGSVRITLEDGELGMFGNFMIDRGEYNFVGGDIFSKKFKIQEGGTVTWDGVAQDPRIAVTAYYSARPNLEPLGTGRDVRVPIDLILNLNGRMGSLENDFYFAYPSNYDAGLTASELNILNSEDQKLLQATSLLITGNFLPVNTGAQTDVSLQNRVTQAGIGQLLSSQINYLLNSSLRNFDFDLNLTGFDQADLGIGLRLFNDRLELRRDGTIVGDQSSIGDLAATYRINQFLSVEIFHRQDLTQTRSVSQEGAVDRVNGVGLQYQVQFSSWRKFLSDLWNAIKSIAS